jgi:hypothetical protein
MIRQGGDASDIECRHSEAVASAHEFTNETNQRLAKYPPSLTELCLYVKAFFTLPMMRAVPPLVAGAGGVRLS